jgi:hypothetical protein
MTYHLIRNHLDTNASCNGCLFETYGAEAEFVRQQPPTKIWTLQEFEGTEVVHAGWHLVNRLGYFLTRETWTDKHEVYDFDSDNFQFPEQKENL